MNPQETKQVIARDEKWVPSTKMVKISPTNVRLETTVYQKEETFQVIIDVIKNSTCFKAFTISAEVHEIFMQQFWENVEYHELIWEDFAFQIDHRKEKNQSQFRDRSKIEEDYQEYRLPILDMMRNNKSKQSESYQIFLKYSTGLIPPKKSRGKGSQGKKTAHVSQELVDVSDESKPKPTKKKTGSRKQEAADAMQALKESKKTSRRQSSTRGLSEGTGRILGVPDESTVVSATSSEGTGTKPGVLAEKKITPKENVILEYGSKHESKHSEDSQVMFNEEEKKDNDGDANDEDEDDDHINVDVEMVGAITVEHKNKEKDEMTDAAKADVEKTAEEKGDAELARNAMTSDYQVKVNPESSKIQTPKINFEQEFEKSALEILNIEKEQARRKRCRVYQLSLLKRQHAKEYDQKSSLYQTMNENKSFNRNPTNHALYHALMEALIEDENAIDKGVVDTVKNHKRQHDDDKDDDEDPSTGPNQGKKTKRRRTKESESSMKPSTTKETSKGKAPSKSSKTGKSATTKKPVEEPIVEVVMDDMETNANEDVVNDANHPQDDVAPKTDKLSRDTWFKQPPRPLTPDPE
ncbi:hypothetical protein Tco_0312437 [Tanacetum coccineum]